MNSLPQLRGSLMSAAERQVAGRSERSRNQLQRRWLHAFAGIGVAGVLVAAGTSIFGPTGNPKYLTQFECGDSAHGDIHDLTNPEPIAACAALWPTLYHQPAPALVAWIYETGGAVVVRPKDQPPTGPRWRPLPRGWTADTATIGLGDQLEDITTGLPAKGCWTAAAANALVRSLLRADGLGDWRVQVSTQLPAADATPRCLSVIQAIGGPGLAPHTVLLVERETNLPPNGVARYPNSFSGQMRVVEMRVNRTLRSRRHCASVATAEGVWRADARAGGIPPARYMLNAPASGASGCARVFVSEPGGGGPADVVAADYP